MENEERQVVAGTGSMEDAIGEVLLMDERSMKNGTHITRATPPKGKFWTTPEKEEDPAENSAVSRSQRKDRASVAIENIMAPEESGRLTRGRMAALLAAGEIPDSQEQEEEKEEGVQETLISGNHPGPKVRLDCSIPSNLGAEEWSAIWHKLQYR